MSSRIVCSTPISVSCVAVPTWCPLRRRCSISSTTRSATDSTSSARTISFSPVLRYLLPPSRQGLVGAVNKFVPDLREESLYALRVDVLEGDPVYAGGTVILFGHRVRLTQRFHLAYMDVQTPETPGRLSLRLDV